MILTAGQLQDCCCDLKPFWLDIYWIDESTSTCSIISVVSGFAHSEFCSCFILLCPKKSFAYVMFYFLFSCCLGHTGFLCWLLFVTQVFSLVWRLREVGFFLSFSCAVWWLWFFAELYLIRKSALKIIFGKTDFLLNELGSIN